jgi:beta-galactosidase
VRSVGIALEKLRDVAGTALPAEVALVHDWENRWALEIIQGFHNERWLRDPERVCHQHYIPYWRAGVPVDVIDMDQDFSKYRVLVAPMLYMLKPGVAERIRAFVEAGGVFVTTYLTGWVDESDLVFDGGAPGPLKDVLGVRVEETDCIYGSESNAFSLDGKNPLALAGTYESKHYCDLLHAEGAEVLATYERDFYAGRPALTRHQLGNGEAYYLATESKQFVDAFHQRLVDTLALRRPVARPLPAGISVCARTDGEREYLFVMNFVGEPQSVTIERGGVDLLSGDAVGECVELAPFGVAVVERPRNA